MGIKTFDKWPDGSTTVDKEHWSSNDPVPEDKPSEDFQTPDPEEEGNNLGLKVAVRPINMFSIMRAEMPLEIVDEINQHIDDTILPNSKDYSDGLVGQLKNDEKSCQVDFPMDDEVGKMFKQILDQCATTFLQSGYKRDATADATQCWVNCAYKGDYNPYHSHGVQTMAGLSGFLWTKVPECIEEKSASVPNINNASGGVDGFTHLCWGHNDIRDILMLKPQTEEYVKPEVGVMLIFPNWLKHQVLPFYGEGERRSIAFNWNVHDTETEMRKYMSEREERQFDEAIEERKSSD